MKSSPKARFAVRSPMINTGIGPAQALYSLDTRKELPLRPFIFAFAR
jgi:hypothetical protein